MLTETQLLHCLRANVKRAMASSDAGERQSLLGAADIVINELLLRSDTTFYLDRYRTGRALADHGLACLERISASPPAIARVMATLPPEPAASIGVPAIEALIETVTEVLQAVIALLPASGHLEVTAFLDAATRWEVEGYARQMTTVPEAADGTAGAGQPEITREKFEAYLRSKFPAWTDVKVTKFSPLHGGFSKKTILVDIEDRVNGPQSLVIRAQMENVMWSLYAGEIPDEYPIVKLAWDAGARVSEPVWLEDNKSLLGSYFLVSRRASGRNLGNATGAFEPVTDTMVRSFAEEIARIHNLDLEAWDGRVRGTVLEPWKATGNIATNTRKQMAFWREKAREYGLGASAVLERGLRWLEDNIEPCMDAPVLVHGDYGIHNVLVEGEQVSAILDWEICHVGDPAEELSWLLACTANSIDPELLLRYYREAGGKPFSEFRLRYWDVLNALKLPLAGLASIAALGRQPDNIQFAVFALRYIHHGASRVADAIRRAEACRATDHSAGAGA